MAWYDSLFGNVPGMDEEQKRAMMGRSMLALSSGMMSNPRNPTGAGIQAMMGSIDQQQQMALQAQMQGLQRRNLESEMNMRDQRHKQAMDTAGMIREQSMSAGPPTPQTDLKTNLAMQSVMQGNPAQAGNILAPPQAQAPEAPKIYSRPLGEGKMQDYMFAGGALQPWGEAYDRWQPKQADSPNAEAGPAEGIDASDMNTIYRQAVGLFGGFVDPTTGRFVNLREGTEAKAHAVANYASRLYMDSLTANKPITQAEAVTEAARELGIEIEGLEEKKRQDPLGLR